jgi:DNA repair protein RecN (Recombination protein N)
MLIELSITDFAIIDHLRLSFDAGLHVLTGETGAGKSIIIDAVSLLLGGRATTDSIRAGAGQARVEGVFLLDDSTRASVQPLLAQYGLEEEADDTLILARELNRQGRHLCRVNGRAVPLKVLQAIAEPLVDIHGQTEHLSLLRVRNHLDLLDRYAGTMGLRNDFSALVRRLRGIRKRLEQLQRDERELARHVDRLEYQIAEIEAAQLQPGEEDGLLLERRRLENASRLLELAGTAYTFLRGNAEDRESLLDALDKVVHLLGELRELEPGMLSHHEASEQAYYLLEDVADALRTFRDEIEFNPARLSQVEDRLDLIYQLKRKYGDTIPEVLTFAENARAELESIGHSAERIEELQVAEQEAMAEIGAAAAELSAARQGVVEELSAAVERELEDLGMSHARFQVRITQKESPDGAPVGEHRYAFDATGIDRVEFLVAPNPGEPLMPLVKIASGGETSRLMLALKTVLSQADATPTLIFDEVDQGIGGRVGGVVGRKLWSVARRHQVLCITHLPQIAVYGDAHSRTQKEVVEGRTLTRVMRLDEESRLDELALMLGATGQAGCESAREMLQSVAEWKRVAG